ncbi:hypothetical protein G4Y79_07275 [Phototrophicus methaneseepsis]|uniref:VOC family protein n=1 Tax=Phototrophicus methaneseepsis TaxID=2710758 RepID=A0A7S8IEY9_9CHLR|nr:VOC family protein [Phototrophicus methaneseepsis]QPC84165.1 hypothetical protein G4Y79_07275 [Phototrophicus methaneseepsis]
MAKEVTIPALPCASISETLVFYTALGFEITYQQERPNTYGCVKRGEIDLHFFSMKGYEPENSYSTCLVLVEDADALHDVFKTGLRQQYGKVPRAGIPRLTRPSNNNVAGERRFNVIDPGGNWIRFIQQASDTKEAPENAGPTTKLGRAIRAAGLLFDSKGDSTAAAQMLDKALAHDDTDTTVIERVRAWLLRAEIAISMQENDVAQQLITKVQQQDLTPEEKEALHTELEQLKDIEDTLRPS